MLIDNVDIGNEDDSCDDENNDIDDDQNENDVNDNKMLMMMSLMKTMLIMLIIIRRRKRRTVVTRNMTMTCQGASSFCFVNVSLFCLFSFMYTPTVYNSFSLLFLLIFTDTSHKQAQQPEDSDTKNKQDMASKHRLTRFVDRSIQGRPRGEDGGSACRPAPDGQPALSAKHVQHRV